MRVNQWLLVLMMGVSNQLLAQGSINSILEHYQSQYRKSFSAERGKNLYFLKNQAKEGVSCSTCHTENPKNVGQTRAHKAIEPLAPSVNAKRFTDLAKVEKWFKRNCDDVFSRECTVEEKGDFISFLMTIK